MEWFIIFQSLAKLSQWIVKPDLWCSNSKIFGLTFPQILDISFQSGKWWGGRGWGVVRVEAWVCEYGFPDLLLGGLTLFPRCTQGTRSLTWPSPCLPPPPTVPLLLLAPIQQAGWGRHCHGWEARGKDGENHSRAFLSSLGDERTQRTLTISHRKIPSSVSLRARHSVTLNQVRIKIQDFWLNQGLCLDSKAPSQSHLAIRIILDTKSSIFKKGTLSR